MLKAGCRFRVLTGWAPSPFVLSTGVQNPLRISSESGVEAALGTPEGQQQNYCFPTALALHLDQLVGYSLQQLGNKAECPQVHNRS